MGHLVYQRQFWYAKSDFCKYLLFILGDVEDFLEGEEGFLELLQPLRLRHLTPLEHLRHVLDVLWVGFNFESERLRDIS